MLMILNWYVDICSLRDVCDAFNVKNLMNIIWNNFWSGCCLSTYQFSIINMFIDDMCSLRDVCDAFNVKNLMNIIWNNFWSGCCLSTYQFSIINMFIDDMCSLR